MGFGSGTIELPWWIILIPMMPGFVAAVIVTVAAWNLRADTPKPHPEQDRLLYQLSLVTLALVAIVVGAIASLVSFIIALVVIAVTLGSLPFSAVIVICLLCALVASAYAIWGLLIWDF